MRNNLHPALWGRDGWSFLKSCAEACDEASLPHYKALVQLLPEILPCEKCREHAREYIAKNPIADAASLSTWFHEFESAVSRRTNAARAPASFAPASSRSLTGAEALGYLGVGALLSVLILSGLALLRCLRGSSIKVRPAKMDYIKRAT